MLRINLPAENTPLTWHSTYTEHIAKNYEIFIPFYNRKRLCVHTNNMPRDVFSNGVKS